MSCIVEILDLLTESQHMYAALEGFLLPLVCSLPSAASISHSLFYLSQILRSLSKGHFESHEDGLNVLNYLLHYSPVISPALWSLFPVLIEA
jgi:hypothetical protein